MILFTETSYFCQREWFL